MGTKANPGEFDCYESAAPDEPMFVLLARDDENAPDRVEEWARVRFAQVAYLLAHTQLPDRNDAAHKEWLTKELRKIAEALKCAQDMRDWNHRQKCKDRFPEMFSLNGITFDLIGEAKLVRDRE